MKQIEDLGAEFARPRILLHLLYSIKVNEHAGKHLRKPFSPA